MTDIHAAAPVESASASTACQTNSSRFAYVLTAAVLGGIIVLAIGICLMVFGALSAWSSSAARWDEAPSGRYAYRYDEPYDDLLDDGLFEHNGYSGHGITHLDW